VIISADISPIVSRREWLVNGVIDRAEMYHVILVRGTPACGKTTLIKLVANELLARYSGDIPLYVITGWDKEQVTLAGNWNRYLSEVTGIEGLSWPTSRAYLLLDEAQESYWDTNL
jgi:predicted AAA+ superfamily ATPase